MKRITVDVRLRDLESFIEAHGLDGPAKWGDSLKASVPAEFMASAHFSMDRDYDTGWELELWYERPETALDRQNEERAQAEREASLEHAEEYALYEKLRAKYEKR